MDTVLIAHSDRPFRRTLGMALKARGFSAVVVPDIATALRIAGEVRPQYFLVEPEPLTVDDESVKARIEAAAGRGVGVLVLTYWATDELAAVYERHGAGLLTAPPEEHDALALQLGWIRSSGVPQAPTKTVPTPPWSLPSSPPAPRPSPPASSLSESWLFSEAPPVVKKPTGDIAGSLVRARIRLDAGDAGAVVSEKSDGPNVLVVDDDPTFRAILCELLAERYRVSASINAPNAIRYLKQHPVDLVITDINMPHIDGFELKGEIDCWSDTLIPFVVVTAQPSDENRAIAKSAGVAAFFAKPILDIKAFLATLHEILAAVEQQRR